MWNHIAVATEMAHHLPVLAQDPREAGFVQDPYPFYDRMREMGPLVFWEDYNLPCAASYEVVDGLLRDRRFGREAPECVKKTPPAHLKPFYDIEAHSMLELDPPRHTKLRRQVLRAFTARQIAGLEPGIATLCNDLIDRFPVGEPFDLLSAYAETLPVTVIARMMGVPDEMSPQLLQWSHDMVAMYQARRDREVENRAVVASLEFKAFVLELIAEKRIAPADDLTSALVNAGDGALSDDEIVTTCILLLNAGHEATVHAIGNSVAAILSSGGAVSEWISSDDALERLVCETMRFDAPLHMFTRYALEDVDICGHEFRTGDEVALLLGAANRDATRFSDPHRFDPTRPVAPHASFGAGIHFCVGAPLARLELRVALHAIFTRCPKLQLSEKPAFADRYHFHGLERLMVQA